MYDFPFDMKDVAFLLGFPQPRGSNSSVYCDCPFCKGHKKMNINFLNNTFRCNKCSVSGGMLNLYAMLNGIDTKQAYNDIKYKLSLDQVEYVEFKKKKAETVMETSHTLADIKVRHNTYTALLNLLSLKEVHYNDLTRRGLVDVDIATGEYKSVPTQEDNLQKIALRLLEEGYTLEGVPGFYRDDYNNWTVNYYGNGYFIPVRDLYGRIQYMQIRLDTPLQKKGKKPLRFLNFSSVDKKDGTKVITFPHFAGRVIYDIRSGMYVPEISDIILTEGPLKADITFALKGWPCIAIPGVNAISQLRGILLEMKTFGLKHLYTAFDMDYLNIPEVLLAYKNLCEMLKEICLPFSMLKWDAKYKGIDDYLFLTQK